MKKIIHKASDRGFQDHGWLKAAYSFSFGRYHDSAKVNFGLLRVLNDDIVAPGMGFGTHGHDNMEIVTIPLKGSLAHRDSLGSEGLITANEVQIMSAGSGIEHSEFNASAVEEVNLLQLWVFPKLRNIEPRYDQKQFNDADFNNKFQSVVSPDQVDGAMWINQNAIFSLGNFSAGNLATYKLKFEGNGAYVFLIEGKTVLDGEIMDRRDAIGVYDTGELEIKFLEDSKVLIVDVPMV